MLHARGQYLLFADADGATRIDDLDQLLEQAEAVKRDGLSVAIGSRSHLVATDAVVKVNYSLFFLYVLFSIIVLVSDRRSGIS